MSEHVLAVDIGGTKIAAARVRDDGMLLERHQMSTPAGDGEKVLKTVLECVDRVRAGDVARIGVGCAGPIDAGLVSPVNIPGWRDFPLADRLRDRLGVPVTVAGDGQAAALAESWLGAARESTAHLGVVVSTGVGAGLVLGGRLVAGPSGNAGHVGHVQAVPGGHACGCGGHGCLEAEISGGRWESRTGHAASQATSEAIVAAGELLGRVLGDVCAVLDLDIVTLAGSVALGFGEPFRAAAQAQLKDHPLPFVRRCRVVLAELGDRAPLIGAAALALRYEKPQSPVDRPDLPALSPSLAPAGFPQ